MKTTGASKDTKSVHVLAAKRTDLKPKSIRSLTSPNDDDEVCYRVFTESKEISYKPFDEKKQVYYRVFSDMHLFVSVSKTGAKSFVYRRYLNNAWREMHLCKFSDAMDEHDAVTTIGEAVAKASNCAAQIERDENPFDQRQAANAEPTLQELFDGYIRGHIQKNGKRTDVTIKDFDRWFDKLAARKASSITRPDAEKFHGQVNKDRGPYAANRAVQMARAIYYYATDKAKTFAGDNPFSGISLFDETPRDRFLSAEEAAKLIQSIIDVPAQHSDQRTLRDFVLLDMFTGARKTCLLSMEWNEIKENAWTIPASKMKNKTGQTINLGENELEILTERRQLLKAAGKISPFVFPSDGSKTGHLTDVKKSWTTLRKKLGFVGDDTITIHDLRRSLASAMANTNANVALIKAAMSHKDMKTTLNVYARTNKPAELEARQLAQQSWLDAMKQLPEADNVADIQAGKRKNKSDRSN